MKTDFTIPVTGQIPEPTLVQATPEEISQQVGQYEDTLRHFLPPFMREVNRGNTYVVERAILDMDLEDVEIVLKAVVRLEIACLRRLREAE